MYPEQLKYTTEHEWVSDAGGEAGTVRVGVTDYAQEQLGDIVYVELPEIGDEVTAGDPCGELESTKSVSDIYAPLSGTVAARNDELASRPELVNSDPYGAGWLIDITPSDSAWADPLLSAAEYQAQVEG